MKITTRREINIERERSITIRFIKPQSLRFCPACQTDAPFVSVDEAAIARQTTSRHIFHLVEAGEIHSFESNEGLLLVCLASLASSAIFNQTSIIKQENNNDTNIL